MDLYKTEESAAASIQVVSFAVGKEKYGVHIGQVQEIIRMTELTRLPQTEEYVKGIINLRGNIIPIIDMRSKFSMEELEYSELTRVIVVNMAEKLVGMVVDSVAKVIELPEKNIEEAPRILHGISKEYIDGIGKMDNDMIIILKIDKVLSTAEIEMLSKRAEREGKKKKLRKQEPKKEEVKKEEVAVN